MSPDASSAASNYPAMLGFKVVGWAAILLNEHGKQAQLRRAVIWLNTDPDGERASLYVDADGETEITIRLPGPARANH